MKRFEDKVVLVTGASDGIGKTTLQKFSEEGAVVINADILVAEGIDVIEEVRKSGGKGLFVKTDVSKEDEVKKLVDVVVGEYGRLDVAYNNAGVEEPNPGKIHTIAEKD